MSGRFAPSPTGDLHLGNLRTAVIAWLAARAAGVGFIIRMEDLDIVQASPEHERSQLADLATLGITSDVEVIRQSERFDRYDAAIDDLTARGLTYECFCSRREVRAEIENSASAPHLPPGAYPGTCRDLTDAQRTRRARDRPPALRLRAPDGEVIAFVDEVAGEFAGGVDDTVLRRNDGVPSYNVAVVLDDHAQGVTQVVRGDDLLSSTPRQIHLQRLFGLPTPTYAHVPLVIGDDGERLSKRHGSVTLADLADLADLAGPASVTSGGLGPLDVLIWIASTIGRSPAPNADTTEALLVALLDGFDVRTLASDPVVAPPWI